MKYQLELFCVLVLLHAPVIVAFIRVALRRMPGADRPVNNYRHIRSVEPLRNYLNVKLVSS